MESAVAVCDSLPTRSFTLQNRAVCDSLEKGEHPDEILQMIQKFKIAVWTGNLRDLAIIAVSRNLDDLVVMAEIPVVAFDKRVEDVG
jgi:hypothetical protein